MVFAKMAEASMEQIRFLHGKGRREYGSGASNRSNTIPVRASYAALGSSASIAAAQPHVREISDRFQEWQHQDEKWAATAQPWELRKAERRLFAGLAIINAEALSHWGKDVSDEDLYKRASSLGEWRELSEHEQGVLHELEQIHMWAAFKYEFFVRIGFGPSATNTPTRLRWLDTMLLPWLAYMSYPTVTELPVVSLCLLPHCYITCALLTTVPIY